MKPLEQPTIKLLCLSGLNHTTLFWQMWQMFHILPIENLNQAYKNDICKKNMSLIISTVYIQIMLASRQNYC